MRKKILVAGAAFLAAATVTAFWYWGGKQEAPAHAFITPDNQEIVARGRGIYASQCAACHGAGLEGQPAWRQRRANGRLPAPPHDPSGHTWHHPDAVLIDIVKNGLVPGRTAPEDYESDMPAYGQLLPDTDIVAVLAYIKSTWPAEVLEMQRTVTLEHAQRQDR